jgi:hypothetical protein
MTASPAIVAPRPGMSGRAIGCKSAAKVIENERRRLENEADAGTGFALVVIRGKPQPFSHAHDR